MVQTRVEVGPLNATVVHDPLPLDGAPLPADIVPGPAGATRTLLQLIPQQRVGSAWDLGCGSGALAAIVAQFADWVVATDIDPRCLELTQQTAQATGVTVETRLGSLTEPVRGEKFDLIVSNPPFVIGNATDLVHRESPLPADGLTRELLTQLPQHLTANGTALLLTAWLQTPNEPWDERIGNWLPAECEAWVGLRELLPVDDYIDVWLRDAGRAGDHATADKWRKRLADWKATDVAFGWVVLHRTSATPFARIEDLRTADRLPNGAEVMERLAAARQAEHLSAAEALTTGFSPTTSQSWRGDIGLDPLLSAIRQKCRQMPLAEAAGSLAEEWQVDADDVLIHALAGVRTLVDLGLLTPA